MKWIVTTLITITGIIIIPILLVDKPKIVYTISDNIPISTNLEQNKTNIQQVEVKNIGNEIGENIKVKIDTTVDSYRIIKDSEQDEIIKYPNVFEMVYLELPPDGSFKLIIESDLKGLNNELLTVKSDRGLAKNALDDEKLLYVNYVYWLILFIYIIVIIYFLIGSLRNTKKENLISSYFLDIKSISYKKPFYYKEKDWKETLKVFIKLKLNEDLTDDFWRIEDSNSYYILSNKKIGYFNNHEWENIENKAKRILLTRIKNEALNELNIEHLKTSFIKVNELNENLNESLSLEINKALSSNYIKKLIIYLYKYINISDINRALKDTKPSFVNYKDWNEYIKILCKLQYTYILMELFDTRTDPLKIINKYNTSILEENKKLEEIAYEIKYYQFIQEQLSHSRVKRLSSQPDQPEWLKDQDYKKLENIFSRFIIKKEKLSIRSEEHTSELQSRGHLVCRLLLEKKN